MGSRGKAVARVGDSTSHGGKILTGHPDVIVNGFPMARVGDKVSCPKCGNNEIATGVPSVSGADHLVATVECKTACGATITTGSPDTFAAEPEEVPVFLYSKSFQLVNEDTGAPIVNMPYVLRIGDEVVAKGRTTKTGDTSRVYTENEEEVELIVGLPAYEIITEKK